jgi:hypothetical protein
VHQILEHDEIKMLQGLGHSVFPLETYFGFSPAELFRPPLEFKAIAHQWMQLFESLGCRYAYGMPVEEQILKAEFIDEFDVVIVMHSTEFIGRHWDVISRRPVVWRTIGVDVEGAENRIAPFRARGCKIVRYSPMESLANSYVGHDAIIRFGKSPDDYAEWNGDLTQVVIFSHLIKARFPVEYEVVAEALSGFPYKISGGGNEGIPNSIGVISYETQFELLRTSRVYLYGVGTFITYTLNFMESWMSGIPLVVLDGRSVLPASTFKFAEIFHLVDHGRNGFIVSSPQQAKEVISSLFADQEMAREIGQRGRETASSLFGLPKIGRLWSEFLSSLI